MAETCVEGHNKSKRLHVRDRISGQMFLVDTGADISLIPAISKIRGEPSALQLFAANDTRINTYGESFRTINIGLRRDIKWNFTIAAVPYPILGADLLTHYGLLVDLRGRRLVDSSTDMFAFATVKAVDFVTVCTVDPSSAYAKILLEFPEITGATRLDPPFNSDVHHHIITTGPPVSERPRRLNPDKRLRPKA